MTNTNTIMGVSCKDGSDRGSYVHGITVVVVTLLVGNGRVAVILVTVLMLLTCTYT